jgi:hypothetical protein
VIALIGSDPAALAMAWALRWWWALPADRRVRASCDEARDDGLAGIAGELGAS